MGGKSGSSHQLDFITGDTKSVKVIEEGGMNDLTRKFMIALSFKEQISGKTAPSKPPP
jgi:hypothetical protein